MASLGSKPEKGRFRPPSLVVKQAEAEIAEAAKSPAETNLAKLQRERAEAEAVGDTRLADERHKKIQKTITIIGRTPEDVRTGLTGATPKDLDGVQRGLGSPDLQYVSPLPFHDATRRFAEPCR